MVETIKVTDLAITLKLEKDGNYLVYIGESYEGKIFKTQDGKRWEVDYKDKENFATPQEAAIRFLKNKAYLDWTDEEIKDWH